MSTKRDFIFVFKLKHLPRRFCALRLIISLDFASAPLGMITFP
jgi:hypothetical protein